MKLVVEGGWVAGIGGVGAMKDSSDHTLAGVDRNACPLAEHVHLGTLGMQVSKGASEGTGVICIA